jgi:uncharacterized membrane-anchored protein
MRLIRLALVLASSISLAAAAEIGTGDPREEVMAKLAPPTSSTKRGNREILGYAGGGRVELIDGRVTSVSGRLPDAAPGSATQVETAKEPLPDVATRPAAAAPVAASKTPSPTGKTPKAATPASRAPAATTSTSAKGTPQPSGREEALKAAGIKFQSGPAPVTLGKVAEVKLPAGHVFIGKDDIGKFYELTHNTQNGSELGVVLGPEADDWMLFFEYDASGYVKDEEKSKLDADKLMKAMTENEDDVNSERKGRGWDAMKVKGWATAPHYDDKTHNLKWAINLASSRDNFKSVWINESIRLLGRGGVMKVTLVVDPPQFKAAEIAAEKMLSDNYSYVAGEKYSEFKKGDKVAAYGLTALVLGGAGVMAVKAGLLGKLGYLLAKLWKVVVALVVVVLAGLKKLLNKITGARSEESTNA